MEVDGPIGQLRHLTLHPKEAAAVVNHQVVALEVAEGQEHGLALERQGSEDLRPAHLTTQARIPHRRSLRFALAMREVPGGVDGHTPQVSENTPASGLAQGRSLCGGIQEVRGSNPLTSTSQKPGSSRAFGVS